MADEPEIVVKALWDRVDVGGEFTVSPKAAERMAMDLLNAAHAIKVRMAEEAATGVFERPNEPGMWERNGNGRVYRVRVAYGLLTMTFAKGNDWSIVYLPHDLLGGWRKVADQG